MLHDHMVTTLSSIGSPTTKQIEHALDTLLLHLARTNPEFASLMRSDRLTQPIPFFGDITSAEIVTIGVNPSADEFAPGRGWPSDPLQSCDLASRLLGYFQSRNPHPWFTGWIRAIVAGTLPTSRHAHLDLSPRATYSFGSFTSGPSANLVLQQRFMEMVRIDLPQFLAFLDLCVSAKLVLLAGGVTKIYMDDFFARELGSDRVRFPLGRRKSGEAPVTRLEMRIGTRWIPGLFVGKGPSREENWPFLAQRLAENREYLMRAFGSPSNAAVDPEPRCC